jgi:hypothetical protein
MLIPTLAPAGEPASANQADPAPAARAASAEAPKPSTWQRLATFWRSAEEQP